MSDQKSCMNCLDDNTPNCLACGINGSLINWKPKVASTTDNVNSPPHYTAGDIECIDAIKASMSKEEYLGYLKGNCIKYLWRYKHKGGAESLAKADWYLQRLRGEMG